MMEDKSFQGDDAQLEGLIANIEKCLAGQLASSFGFRTPLDPVENALELWGRKGASGALTKLFVEAFDVATTSEQFLLSSCADGLHRLWPSRRQVRALMKAKTLCAMKLTSWSTRPDSGVLEEFLLAPCQEIMET